MDPHLRWLRRLVIARTIERLAIEATIAGGGAALGATALGWRPAEILTTFLAVSVIAAGLRFGLAVSTNPVSHRYLLQWTDPSATLRASDRTGQHRPDDQVTRELEAGSFRFLARLERGDGPVLEVDQDETVDEIDQGARQDGRAPSDRARRLPGRRRPARRDQERR